MSDLNGMYRPRYEKVIVLAPAHRTTGGPELLHQLVHEIRELGGEAFIHYRPDALAEVPEPYRIYNVSTVTGLPSSKDCCIVAPETMYRDLPLRTSSQRVLWWLSYDFFKSKRESRFGRGMANAYKFGSLYILTATGVRHLFQSHYARGKLDGYGISGQLLTDYLSIGGQLERPAPRKNVVLFNPKKGFDITRHLIEACPDFTFLPLIDMSRCQVDEALRSAKVYIDFGEHPGKDRLPREAAMHGAVVLVGSRGSAANDQDVPLPPVYKLNISSSLDSEFRQLVGDVFSNFDTHQKQQNDFRKFVSGERATFCKQVKDIFFTAQT